MAFDFGCAARLYRERQHPRLLIGPGELTRLRGHIRRGAGRKLHEALRRKVGPLVRAVERSGNLPALVAHHAVRKDPIGGWVLEYLADLALAGALDEDARILNAVRRVLLALPEAERLGPRDTYSIGWASWGNTQLGYDLAWDSLSGPEREAFASWASDIGIRQVMERLRAMPYERSAGANIPMVGMISACLTLLAIEGDPGCPALAPEKAELLRWFEASLHAAIGPNGYPVEDIGYGSGMVSLLARVAEAWRRAGVYDVYRRCPRYARFGQAMLHFVQPWGEVLSNTGDYGADFGWRSVVFPRLAAETEDPALLWLHGTLSYPIACSGPMDMKSRRRWFPELTLAPGFQVPVDAYSLLTLDDLRRPVPPTRTRPPTQFMDPLRGIVTFRSGWDSDATFVVFDGSQRSCAAPGHNHDSGAHFSLSALGEHFACDTGRYSIEQEHHNVVIVDGRSGHMGNGSWQMSRYEAVLTGYAPAAFVDTASVDYSQMSSCYWARRRIGLVKDAGSRGVPAYAWTVEDVNRANDFHEFWWLLNTHPDNRIRLFRDHATLRGCRRGNLLDVHFALPAPGEYPKPHTLALAQNLQLAGSPREYGGDPHATALAYRRQVGNLEWGPVFERPRLVAKVSGYNGRFASVMIPRRRGQAPARVERLPTINNVLAVRITFAHVEDTLVWAHDHNLLDAADVSGRGQWCVVRRARRTRRVLAWELGQGTELSADGRRLA